MPSSSPLPLHLAQTVVKLAGHIASPEAMAAITKGLPALLRMAAGGRPVDEFGMDPSLMHLLRPFFQFLYCHYFRVEVRGALHIPPSGAAILVGNHSGALPYDATMVHMAVYNEHPDRRIVRFLVDDFVFAAPLLGSFVSRAGGVRASPENAMRLLREKNLIVVFPEGTRGVGKMYNERYRLTRFGRGGFIRVAMQSRAPIIPVAIIGAEEIHPIVWKSRILARPLGVPFIPFTPTFPWLGPLGLVPLPSKWQIIFGKPIPFDRFEASDAGDEALVERHAERVRAIVQGMIDRALAKRRSIWI